MCASGSIQAFPLKKPDHYLTALLTIRDVSPTPCYSATAEGPAPRRRGVLLWEFDRARPGPSLQELSLLCARCAVGETAHLDRPLLTVQLDRQEPLGIARSAAA